MGSGRGWLAGDWPSTGAFLTLLRRPGLRASFDGVLATNSERKMLASTCLYSLYAWLILLLIVLILSLSNAFSAFSTIWLAFCVLIGVTEDLLELQLRFGIVMSSV